MKKVLLIVVMLYSFINSATIISVGTGANGYLDNGAMWVGGVAPSDNDSFVISAADTLTIRYPFTGKFSMDSALTTKYNRLVVNAKLTLTGRCDLRTYNELYVNDTLNLNANTIYYKTTSTSASRYRFHFIGTSSDTTVVMSTTHGGGILPATNLSNSASIVNFKYTKFFNLSSSKFKTNATGQFLNVTNCLFDTCRYFHYDFYATNLDSVKFNYNYIREPVDTLIAGIFGNTYGTVTGIKKEFIGNIIDFGYEYNDNRSFYRFLTSTLRDFTFKKNRFIVCQPVFTGFEGAVDSNFFYGVTELPVPATVTRYRNNVFFSPFDNPHVVTPSENIVIDSSYFEFKADTIIQPSLKTTFDYGDICIPSTTGNHTIKNNIFKSSGGFKKYFGSIYIFLNSVKNCSANIYNNTYVVDSTFSYGAIRNENAGYGGTGIVKVYNNIFYSRKQGDGLVCRFERAGEPDQVDSMDYNNIYNFNAPFFSNFEITGKDSGDAWFNSVLPKNDPQFSNPAWDLTIFAHSKGYDSTTQGVYNAFIDSNYTADVLQASRAAYTPTNAVLDNTGFSSGDYGAVDFDATGKIEAAITSHPQNTSVIEGQTATFNITATGTNLTYQWVKNGSNVGTNSNSYSFATALSNNGDSVWCIATADSGNPAMSNKAYLTVTQAGESFDSTEITSDIGNTKECPQIIVQIESDTVAVGSDSLLSFIVQAQGTNLTYQWKFNGTNVGSNVNYYQRVGAKADSGKYVKCVITGDTCSPVTTDSVLVAVIGQDAPAPPVITLQPHDTTVNAGSTATFTTSATGATNYQWWLNDIPVDGATSPSYSFTATSGMNGYPIYCAIWNDYDFVHTDTVTLTVTATPPAAITTQPQNANVTAGQTATFTIAGTNINKYQWYGNNTLIPGATGSSYSFTATIELDGSTIFCIVNDTLSSDTVTLTVNPVVTFNQSVDTLNLVCANNVNVQSWQWYKDNVVISGATDSVLSVVVDSTSATKSVYYCQISNGVENKKVGDWTIERKSNGRVVSRKNKYR